MKVAINTQSQNEVKDLLNEYVVSPLNTDISTTLSKISAEIESLEEITKADTVKISTSINGSINRLRTLLDTSFHFEEDDDVFENLSDKIESSQDSVVDKINDCREELESNISKQIKIFEKTISKLQSAYEVSTNDIKNELLNLQTLISNENVSLSKQMIEFHKKVEELVNEKNDALAKQINTNLQNISDGYLEQSTAICNYHEETITSITSMESRQHLFVSQKLKTILISSLTFGILNTLGFIIMIVLYLMK